MRLVLPLGSGSSAGRSPVLLPEMTCSIWYTSLTSSCDFLHRMEADTSISTMTLRQPGLGTS